jgi:hypothetical protein
MEVQIGPRGPGTHPVIPATDDSHHHQRPPPINHGSNYQQNGLFDDFAFFGVLAVDIAALLDGFRRRFWGLMTIDDQDSAWLSKDTQVNSL